MTIRVRETRSTANRRPERLITLSMRVYAGAPLQPGLRHGLGADQALSEGKLAEVTERIQAAITTVWHAFSLSTVDGEQVDVDYRFQFRIEAAPHTPYVWGWVSDGDDIRDIRLPEGISVADAFRAANSEGFDNIAVVHPYIRRVCAPRVEASGAFTSNTELDRDHPDILPATSTVMTLGRPRILEAGNITAAHEAGHLMGLPDGNYDRHAIMISNNQPDRHLTPRDQMRIHHVVENANSGVIWEGERPRRRRPRARRRRRRR